MSPVVRQQTAPPDREEGLKAAALAVLQLPRLRGPAAQQVVQLPRTPCCLLNGRGEHHPKTWYAYLGRLVRHGAVLVLQTGGKLWATSKRA